MQKSDQHQRTQKRTQRYSRAWLLPCLHIYSASACRYSSRSTVDSSEIRSRSDAALCQLITLDRNGHVCHERDTGRLGGGGSLVPAALALLLFPRRTRTLRLEAHVLSSRAEIVPDHLVVPALLATERRVPSVVCSQRGHDQNTTPHCMHRKEKLEE